MMLDSILYLENGHLFEGYGFGAKKTSGGEVVFNTGMTGYQEIFTDPSYCHQIVTMTYPHIGNTGINSVDVESGRLFLSGVVAREFCETPSSWRSEQGLGEYLETHGIPGISNVDTRAITQIIRNEGAQRGIIFRKDPKVKDFVGEAKKKLSEVANMEGLELVSQVSCKHISQFPTKSPADRKIVVYDFGVKTNILRQLALRDFEVWIVPHNTPQQEVLALKPTAVFLSNGPGDPSQVKGTVEEIQKIIGKVPIFAICMGHQLLARALGVSTYKLKFGHHGVNHPVNDLVADRILITSQNHGFAVGEDIRQVEDTAVTHVSLNDQTIEGFASEKMRLMSVQFHPEAAPGPHDANSLFDRFVRGFIR